MTIHRGLAEGEQARRALRRKTENAGARDSRAEKLRKKKRANERPIALEKSRDGKAVPSKKGKKKKRRTARRNAQIDKNAGEEEKRGEKGRGDVGSGGRRRAREEGAE